MNRTTIVLAAILPGGAPLLLAACTDQPQPPGAPDRPRSIHASGLELHWTFQDRSGSTILDMSGNGRDGTLSGGSFVSSPWGEAVSLDGVDDKISFTGPRDPDDFGGATSGEFTISAHVRVDDVSRYNTLCNGCAPHTTFTVGTDNVGDRLLATLYNGATMGKVYPTSTASLTDDTWMTVTLVVEAGVGTNFYIDCQHDRFVEDTDIELKDYSYSAVGEGFNANSWYEGEIDDLKVWNHALTADEIADLCPCRGVSEAATLGIVPPLPPAVYSPPAENPGTVEYVDPSNLQTKVSTAGVTTLVLEDGVYTTDDITGDYLQIKGQALWAEHLGGAVLEFGVAAGGNSTHADSELHGLVFDIQDSGILPTFGSGTYSPADSVISAWGNATGLLIEDCRIHGNDNGDTGIYVASPDGFEAHRLEIDGLHRYGMLIEGAGTVTNPMPVTDIRVWDIDDPSESTSGVGIRLGETATLSRANVRDVRWAGVVINGDSDGSTVSYVDVDRVGTSETTGRVGIYLDNVAREVTVDHFCVGPDVRIGVNSEWDHWCDVMQMSCTTPEESMFPRGIDNVVEYGLSEAELIGVHFDQGTVNGDVNNVTFRNYSRAAIVLHNNVSTEMAWPTYDDGSSQSSNTFEETESNCSICDVTYSVWNDTTPQCVGSGAC